MEVRANPGIPMRRFLAILLLLPVPAQAAAAPQRASVDREAIGEAIRSSTGAAQRYASSRAYEHYLTAKMAEGRGDLVTARQEMQIALIYDERSPDLRLEFAWLLARTDDLPRSVVELERVLQAAPASAPGWLLMGKIRAAQRRKTEALAALDRAISLEPRNPEAYLVQVRLHADFGERAAAEAVADKLEAHHLGDAALAWRLLAKVALERSEPAAARRYLGKAVQLDDQDTLSRLRLAELLERVGEVEQAAGLYRDVLALQPSEPRALLGAARQALRQGDDGGARAYFQQLLGTARDPVKAALDVITSWGSHRKPGEALAVLEQAAALQSDPRLLLSRGLLLASDGRHVEAAAAFALVPEESGPIYVMALARWAESLSLAGRHEEAFSVLERGLRTMKASLEWEELAEVVPGVYRRAGRSAEAITFLEAHAGSHPRDLAMVLALGKALQDAGRADQALALLSSELVRSPGETRLVFALAAARERAGDPDGAVSLMQALLRADPDNAAALNFLGYIWADRGERLEEACSLVGRALELHPDEPSFLDSLGWCEFRRGNIPRAIALLEKANELAPREAVLYHHLAAAYAKAGRLAEANRHWRLALELLERDPDPRVQAEIREAMGEPGRAVSGR